MTCTVLVYHTATTARNVCNIIVRADEISAYNFEVAAFHLPTVVNLLDFTSASTMPTQCGDGAKVSI